MTLDGRYQRIVLRKMPPAINHDNFIAIPVIRSLIENKKATVDVYPSDIVGETSAACTAFAVINGSNFTEEDVKQLSEITLDLPFGGRQVHPEVEFAPIQMNVDRYKHNTKQLPSIDDDPEFATFAKKYKEKMMIPTENLVDIDAVQNQSLQNSHEIIKKFNVKLLGQQGGNANPGTPGTGKKKNKNKKNKNKNKGNN